MLYICMGDCDWLELQIRHLNLHQCQFYAVRQATAFNHLEIKKHIPRTTSISGQGENKECT